MNQEKQGYKLVKTSFNKNLEIPQEWEIKKIEDIAYVKGGKRLPLGHKLTNKKTAYPYIRVIDFEEGTVDLTNLKFLEKQTYERIKQYTISSNDVYISIVGTIGLSGIIPEELDGANLTENAAKICELKNIEKEFLSLTLQSNFLQTQIQKHMSKSSQPKLALINIKKLKLFLPKLNEQKKIASILSNIDLLIQRTKNIIESNQSLMSEFTTKLMSTGIGHTKFKETKIGKIPYEWEILPMKDICRIERGKFSHRPRNDPSFYGGKYPFIQTGDVENSDGFITEYSQTLNEKGFLVSKIFPRNIVVITIAANIGSTAITTFPVCFPDSIVGIIPNNMDVKFLKYFLDTKKNILNNIATTNAQKNINLETLKPLLIPVPTKNEQEKIAKFLFGLDQGIKFENNYKSQLENLKKGLMQKLLTGQIRV